MRSYCLLILITVTALLTVWSCGIIGPSYQPTLTTLDLSSCADTETGSNITHKIRHNKMQPCPCTFILNFFIYLLSFSRCFKTSAYTSGHFFSNCSSKSRLRSSNIATNSGCSFSICSRSFFRCFSKRTVSSCSSCPEIFTIFFHMLFQMLNPCICIKFVHMIPLAMEQLLHISVLF